MSNSLTVLTEQFKDNITPFKPDGSDILTDLMFESWVSIPMMKIVRLLLMKKTSRLYNIKAISVMIQASLGTTSTALKRLTQEHYLELIDHDYRLNLNSISNQNTETKFQKTEKEFQNSEINEDIKFQKTETQYIYNNINTNKEYIPPTQEIDNFKNGICLPKRSKAYTEEEQKVLKSAIPIVVEYLELTPNSSGCLVSNKQELEHIRIYPKGLVRLILHFKGLGMGKADLGEAFVILNDYIANNTKGQKYKDHAAAICSWVVEKIQERKKKELDLQRSETYLANAITGVRK